MLQTLYSPNHGRFLFFMSLRGYIAAAAGRRKPLLSTFVRTQPLSYTGECLLLLYFVGIQTLRSAGECLLFFPFVRSQYCAGRTIFILQVASRVY